MAIEIVDFPIKHGGSFHSYVKLPEGNIIPIISSDEQLVGGFKHEWIIFHFIYGMSSETHWRSPSFFKMLIFNHQPDKIGFWIGVQPMVYNPWSSNDEQELISKMFTTGERERVYGGYNNHIQ